MAEKEKKPNFITRWWRETIGELRRVSWPTPAEPGAHQGGYGGGVRYERPARLLDFVPA